MGIDYGAYNDSFFLAYIYKNAYDTFSIQQTIYHEYIHYIQNISTTYCLKRYENVSKTFQNAIVKLQRTNTIKIPIDCSNDSSLKVYKDALSVWDGDSCMKEVSFISKIMGGEESMDISQNKLSYKYDNPYFFLKCNCDTEEFYIAPS